jgi:hypothetical protein
MKQVFQCTSLVKIGLHSGDTLKEVATQLFECRVKASQEDDNDAIREQVRSKMMKRLAGSLENYGIVGFKRWYVEVMSMRVMPIFEEEECNGNDSGYAEGARS